MGFSFTATAECDKCGALLSSSDTNCDHNGSESQTRVFRKFTQGRESLVTVDATKGWMWNKLKEERDEWIAYQYIGTEEYVKDMVNNPIFGDVSSIPAVALSIDSGIVINDE